MFKIGDIVELIDDLFFDGILRLSSKQKGEITKKIDIDLFEIDFYACKFLINSKQIKLAESLSPPEPTISKAETVANPNTSNTDYTIKSDQNKPRLSLVPILPLWESVARIREYGVNKYGDNECWKEVELKRYHDALLRHTAAISTDINAIDEESGMPHRWHIACNLAFIEYLIKED